jgi:flagellar biosynthesis protein FlhF
MKMRSFTAPTIAEAMKLVRESMGEEAIIIASGPNPKGPGMMVTAAADDIKLSEPIYENPVDIIGSILDKHATPRMLSNKILKIVEQLEVDDPNLALSAAFDAYFKFLPLPASPKGRPILLMGVPGVGKTVTVAKLAARSVMQGNKTICITTDAERAGAVEQLEAFTKILKIELLQAPTVQSLKDALAACPSDAAIFIDTAGINILKPEEVDYLRNLISVSNADLTLVYAAGGNAEDAIDIGGTFRDLGAERLLVTRLDITKRFGSVLAVADAGKVKFSDVSITPHIANGLNPINPVSLARLFLPFSTYNA